MLIPPVYLYSHWLIVLAAAPRIRPASLRDTALLDRSGDREIEILFVSNLCKSSLRIKKLRFYV